MLQENDAVPRATKKRHVNTFHAENDTKKPFSLTWRGNRK